MGPTRPHARVYKPPASPLISFYPTIQKIRSHPPTKKKKREKKKSTHTLRARRGGSIREEIERDGRLLLDLVGVRSGGERLGLRLAEELPPDLPRRPVPPQARTFRAPFSLLPRVFFFWGFFFVGVDLVRGVAGVATGLGFAWCGMRQWI